MPSPSTVHHPTVPALPVQHGPAPTCSCRHDAPPTPVRRLTPSLGVGAGAVIAVIAGGVVLTALLTAVAATAVSVAVAAVVLRSPLRDQRHHH
ncbi:hypothetical protein GQS52_15740 [Streptomyces sp. SCUT-3]|nr:hypothetical protein C0036_13890 [Streptomyces sp. DJ]QMV25134.1 hypothetical protein GQS52_15740 [Streptomyces sp. SCUT-3]